jgi:hypothetical protein
MPVVGKTMAPGETEMAAPVAPVPLSNTVAGVVTDEELMVNTPVVAPLAVGAKIAAAVQLAPAARLAPQVVCDTLKGGGTVWPDTVRVNPLAGYRLVLVNVTVCDPLDCPMAMTPKLN